jgi:predicted Zn-dependent protease
LAQTKLSKGDLAGAEAVLKKASQDSPKNADLPRYLAELYIFQRKFAEADKQLHSAISLDPKDGAALLALSRLQLTTGQKNEAEQNFKRLSEFRGYEPVYAQFLYEEGRKDESVRELERLFKKDPADRSARTRLVAAYRAVNRVQDAKKVLADALAKNAHDSDALLQRGEI